MLYVLHPDGKIFTENTPHTDLILESEEQDLRKLILLLSRIVRYGLYLQVYQGNVRLYGNDWKAVTEPSLLLLSQSLSISQSPPLPLSQSQSQKQSQSLTQALFLPLPQIDESTIAQRSKSVTSQTRKKSKSERKSKSTIGDGINLGIEGPRSAIHSQLVQLEEIEGPGILDSITELCLKCFPSGAYISPLIANNEILFGILIMKGINDIPYALYADDNTKLIINKSSKDDRKSSTASSKKKAHVQPVQDVVNSFHN